MLSRACIMLRREAKDRSWLDRLQKLSSSFLWLCKSMVWFFNLFYVNLENIFFIYKTKIKKVSNINGICWHTSQVTLVSLSMLMTTDLVRLWWNWMEDWTNVVLSVPDLMLVSRKLSHGLLDFCLQDRLVFQVSLVHFNII